MRGAYRITICLMIDRNVMNTSCAKIVVVHSDAQTLLALVDAIRLYYARVIRRAIQDYRNIDITMAISRAKGNAGKRHMPLLAYVHIACRAAVRVTYYSESRCHVWRAGDVTWSRQRRAQRTAASRTSVHVVLQPDSNMLPHSIRERARYHASPYCHVEVMLFTALARYVMHGTCVGVTRRVVTSAGACYAIMFIMSLLKIATKRPA